MKNILLFIGIMVSLVTSGCGNGAIQLENPSVSEQDTTLVFQSRPSSFHEPIEAGGIIQEINYASIGVDGTTVEKTAFVYLPAEYDENEQYDILYLMHGGGGNPSTLLGTTARETEMKYALDHMIQDELIQPVIAVMPTFYMQGQSGMNQLNELTRSFQRELREDLIPLVESTYSTYAASTSEEDLIASRDHRLFSGFSMGGVTTWYVLTENLAYFRYFIPSSGDSWAVQQMGGSSAPQQTARYLAEAIREQGYGSEDFMLYAVTGTSDMAFSNMNRQIAEMQTLTDVFIYNSDPQVGNFYYLLAQEGQHTYGWYYDYLYTLLPLIF